MQLATLIKFIKEKKKGGGGGGREREGGTQKKREEGRKVWFVLFNDTWSQKGHSVSCMTILFISKCKSADRTSGRT